MGDGRRVVLWTRAARDSLDEILAFIALGSPAVASKVAEDVLGAADSLSLFAERGRVVPETDTITIREIFVYRYRLMYQAARRSGRPVNRAVEPDRGLHELTTDEFRRETADSWPPPAVEMLLVACAEQRGW